MPRIFSVLLVFTVLLISCYPKKKPAVLQQNTTTPAHVSDFSSAPFVPAEESVKKMILEDGFEIRLVASEPIISSPVAMNFDNKGRMWVVEMEGYMTDADGTEEDKKNGRIVILEDKNNDGVVDKRKVFVDSLVLPRALCLVENGILVAEPPRLWYIEIQNDKPGKKILIDESYTEGGNVEAQANGLFRAMDNWIYSGGSEKRYRKVGDKWLTERTHLRGQWGITQDDYGRLYYNNNSQNLLGDYFTPGLGAGNENMQRVRGFNERLISDNRVYPGRPTPGVNRGYKDNVLDSLKRLVSFTAACGPALYRGDLFSKEYYNNVFVAEPAANLIKRNLLPEGTGFTTSGKQAYQGKEFLVSLDERFRPVSLYNGPDGALYVVDMYRGIIQHKSFLTDYLKNEIAQRSLAKPVNCGRIYKIVPKGSSAKAVRMPSDVAGMVAMLKHPNGWIRDKAQQMLVDGKYQQAIPKLRDLLKDGSDRFAVIHALWTLEGLGALNPADMIPLLENQDWTIRVQALSALPSAIKSDNYKEYMPVLQRLASKTDTLTAPYVAFQAKSVQVFDKVAANALLEQLGVKYPSNLYVTDAIISNLKGQEADFYKHIAMKADTSQLLYTQLRKVIGDIKSNASNKDVNLLRKQYPRGASLFRSTCQPCHGVDGNGIRSLAPPLNRSEWVTGDKDKLIAILLHGLSGPVQVNNKIYKAPEINGDMPGIGSNKDIVDEDIAQLLSYIRNSWSNGAEKISREDVIKIRKKFSNRQGSFTVAELESW